MVEIKLKYLIALLVAIISTFVVTPPLFSQTVIDALNRVGSMYHVGSQARLANQKERNHLVSYMRENGSPMPQETYLLEGRIAKGKGKAVVYVFATDAEAQRMYEVSRRVSQSEMKRLEEKQTRTKEYWYVMTFNENSFEGTTAFLIRMKYQGITVEEASKAPDAPGKKSILATIKEWEGKNLQSLNWRQANMVVALESMIPTASGKSIKPFGRTLYGELAFPGANLTVKATAPNYEDSTVSIPLTSPEPTSILITGRILNESSSSVEDVKVVLEDPKTPGETKSDGTYRIFTKLKEPDDKPFQTTMDITMKQSVVLFFSVKHKAYKQDIFDSIKLPSSAGKVLVSGKVTDRYAKRPVQNAEVSVYNLLGISEQTLTDPSGKYEITLKLDGREEVQKEKSALMEGDNIATYLGFLLKPGKYPVKKHTVKSRRYEPVKTLRVKGNVVDPDGNDVSGALVTLMISGIGKSDTKTNSDGKFQVDIEVNPDGMWRQSVKAGKLEVGIPDPVDVVIKKIKDTSIGDAMDKKFLAAADKLVGDRLDHAPATYRLMWKNAGAVVALKSDVDKIKEALLKGDRDAIKKAMKFENFKKYKKVLQKGGLGEYASALNLMSKGVENLTLKSASDLETKVKELNDKFKENTGVDILKETGYGQQKGQTALQKSFHQLLLHVGQNQYAIDNIH